MRSLNRLSVCCLAAAIAVMVTGAPRVYGADAGPPRVIRTFTHHQITAIPQGINVFQPVVTDSGNRILLGVNPVAEGRSPGLSVVDYDGRNLVTLDDTPDIRSADISADGSRIVYVISDNEIRIVGGDGGNRRTLLKAKEGISTVRISGDGRTVIFLVGRGMNVLNGDKLETFIRGIYAMSADGGGFRRVAGPDEVARLRGIKPEEVGNPNFGLAHHLNPLDLSSDGRRIVFGCYAKVEAVLLGCDIDGGNLHTILGGQPTVPGEWADHNFTSVSLSGDGTTVGYLLWKPDDLGVIGFDGRNQRTLAKQGEDPKWGTVFGGPIYLTTDGARLTHQGRHFNTDGSGVFSLMATHQEGVLRYGEYETPAMDALGRRFAYFAYTPRPLQLATMELNVPQDQLRGAPKLSEITVDPGAIPYQKPDIIGAKTAARATADPMPGRLSWSGFKNGIYDERLTQGGSVGITDMLDDGKTEERGDAKAGDGVFTNRWLYAYPDAPADPPRTIRFEAQVQDAQKLYHAHVVEVGPFPVVDGKPQVGPVTIDGVPPPPPTVSNPPGVVGLPPGVVPPVTPVVPPVGAIDLSGYWKTDTGDPYYLRQIGDTVYWYLEGLPRVRNVFVGTIAGGVLTGTWADLPGGAIDMGTGTIKLTIDSNDKLTKTSATIPYAGTVWTRIAKPGAVTGPGTATGPGPGVAPPPPVVGNPQPFQTPAGRALIDRWIAESMAKLNAHKGGDPFNARKPYSINKYGLLEGKGLVSAFAPDNFKDYGYDRYAYMWDYWVPSPVTGWRFKEFNDAKVEALRDFVLSRLPPK